MTDILRRGTRIFWPNEFMKWHFHSLHSDFTQVTLNFAAVAAIMACKNPRPAGSWGCSSRLQRSAAIADGPLSAVVQAHDHLIAPRFDRRAKGVSMRRGEAVARADKNNGILREFYLPDNGEPVMNPGFQDWNYLVLNMIAWYEGKPKWKNFDQTMIARPFAHLLA